MDGGPGFAFSRRALLTASTAAVATVAAPWATPPASASGESVALSADPVLHLLRRTSFGPTPETVAEARGIGIDAFVDRQLNPDLIVDTAAASIASAYPTTTMSNAAVRSTYANAPQAAARDITGATLARQAYSRRQLYEVLVDFWSNHFNVYCWDAPVAWYKPAEDREVIRRHALSTFRELLSASARSPAMLCSLDNAWSTAANPNENYGRELLELHTVGVDAGYGEADVRAATLALTGWSVDFNTATAPGTHEFRYRPTWHHTGALEVMGWRCEAHTAVSGEAVGQSLLDHLARHPATAEHLARKLCRRLVADDPPETLVSSAAAVYLRHDTAIVPVVRHILRSTAFAQAVGVKVRRPAELLVAAVRATGVSHLPGTTGGESLRAQAYLMSQCPFTWLEPDGYPDVTEPWVSPGGMVERWKGMIAAGHGLSGLSRPDASALAGGLLRPPTAGATLDALCERLVFQRFAPAHRSALLQWLGKGETDRLTDQELAAVGPRLLALILGAPYLQLR